MKKRISKMLAAAMMLGSISYGIPIAAQEAQDAAAVKEENEGTEASGTCLSETGASETGETDVSETGANDTGDPETNVSETDASGTSVPDSDASETNKSGAGVPEMDAPDTNKPATEIPEAEGKTDTIGAGKEDETQSQSDAAEAEEPSETLPEADPETERDVFMKGYARTIKAVSVYTRKETVEDALMGTLTEHSVLYAVERFGEGKDENEWLRAVFAVKDGEEILVREGYIQAKYLEPVSEEEKSKLMGDFDAEELKTIYQNGSEGIVLAVSGFTLAGQQKDESEASTEAESDIEPKAVYQISADWEGDSLGIGDQIILTALCSEDDVVEWQYCTEDGGWKNVAEGQTYTYELTMENYSLRYRAVPADQTEVSES